MTATTSPASSPAPDRTRRTRDLVAALLLLVASVVFVAEQVAEHDRLSFVDEYQYIDNLAKTSDQLIVRQGEKTGLYARRYGACHGVRVIDAAPTPEACVAKDAGGEIYPLGGGTTGDLYTPVYFLVTRVLAQPLVWAGLDLVDAARTVGGLWLGAAAVVMYAALRRRGVPVAVAAGTGLVLIGSLPAYWANTYVSTDATALLAGSAALFLALEAARGRRTALVLLPVLAVLSTLAKVQNLVAFVAAACFLVLVALTDRGDGSRGVLRRWRDVRVGVAVVSLVAAVAAQVGWLALRSALAVGPSPDDGVGGPFDPSSLWFELSNFAPRLAVGGMPTSATGPTTEVVVLVGQLLTLGGAVGLAVAARAGREHRALALATLATAVLAAPALALAVVASEGEYFTMPARYGMSLLPWALACFALVVDRRSPWVGRAVLAVGSLVWLLSLTLGDVA